MFAVLLAIFACPATSQSFAQQDPPPDAAARLEARGLIRSGNTWVTAQENELRELLAKVRKQDAELRAAAKQADQALAENNRQLALVNQARKEAEEFGRQIDSGTLNVKQINQLTLEFNRRVEFINQAGPNLFDAASRVNSIPLGRLQQKRMELRNSLQESLAKVDRLAETWESSYEGLKDDPAIAADLAEMGKQYRLGPAKNYAPDLARLNRARTSVQDGQIPVNREEDDYRLWVIFNDQQGLQFVYRPDAQWNILTPAAVEELGLEVPADSTEESLSYLPDREVTGRKLPPVSLRLGNQVFPEVTFYVVGVKDADLGSSLGNSALAGAKIEFLPQLLTLKLSGAEPREAPPADK